MGYVETRNGGDTHKKKKNKKREKDGMFELPLLFISGLCK